MLDPNEKWEEFMSWTGFAVMQNPRRYRLPGSSDLVTAKTARAWYEHNKDLYERHTGCTTNTYYCNDCGCACLPYKHRCHID